MKFKKKYTNITILHDFVTFYKKSHWYVKFLMWIDVGILKLTKLRQGCLIWCTHVYNLITNTGEDTESDSQMCCENH